MNETTSYHNTSVEYIWSTAIENNFDYESFRNQVRENIVWDYSFAVFYLIFSVSFVSLKLPKYDTRIAYTIFAAISVLLTLPMAIRTVQVVITMSWSRSPHVALCDAYVDNFTGFWIACYKYYFYFHNIDIILIKLSGRSTSLFIVHHNTVFFAVPYLIISNFSYFRTLMAIVSVTILAMSMLHLLRGVNLISAETSYTYFIWTVLFEDFWFLSTGLYVLYSSLTDNCDSDINITYFGMVFMAAYNHKNLLLIFEKYKILSSRYTTKDNNNKNNNNQGDV
ncbi:hypothetical protein HDE_12216 [Halotydeus destructor]|nr:hypothetical protein HDE_12216 [Halotydeus destructor]